MRKSIKCVLTICIMILSCVLLSSCAKVDYSRVFYYDGAVEDTIFVTLDKQKISDAGIDVSTVKETILSDFRQIVGKINTWKNKFSSARLDVKKYVEEGVSAVANTVDDGVYLNIKYLDYQLFTMVYNDVEFDGVQYEKAFSHNYAPDFATTSGIAPIKVDAFILKYGMTYVDSAVANVNDENYQLSYTQSVLDRYSTHFSSFTSSDVTINEIIGVSDDRLHSNADETQVDSNMTYHYFYDLLQKDSDFQLQFFKYAPYTVSWYVLALIIAGAVLITIVTVVCVRSKRGK